MKRKRLLTVLVAVCLLSFAVVAGAQTPVLSSGPGVVPQGFLPSATVLWDQPVGASVVGVASQKFDPPNAALDIFAADDFMNAVPWNISTIYVPGTGADLSNAASLNWALYADAGGVPAGDPYGGGAAPVWSLSLPPADPQVTLSGSNAAATLTLNVPVALPPGSYWLIFYPDLDFTSFGQWWWYRSDTTNLYLAQIINPPGGWGFGASWASVQSVAGGPEQDLAFTLTGDPAVCANPPSDITAWWPFETPLDIVNGNVLTGYGAGAVVPAMVGNGILLDGATAYVEAPDNPTLNMGTGDFSVDAWIKTTITADYQAIVDKRQETSPGFFTGYSFFVDQNTGHLGFQLGDLGVNFTVWSATNVADGAWHHVAATVTRGSATGLVLYVDGTAVATFSGAVVTGNIDNTGTLRIGRNLDNTLGINAFFNGMIDEVELFKRALAADEVKGIYEASSLGKCVIADLALTKTGPATVVVPNNITYTLGISNAGPVIATGVTLTDTLPAGVTYVSATPSQGSCGEAAGVVTCDIGSLAVGGSATVSVVVTPTAPGVLTNVADVTANEADLTPADNHAEAVTTATQADLIISRLPVVIAMRTGGVLRPFAPFDVKFWVKNQGTAAAPATVTRFFLSRGRFPGGFYLGDVFTPALAPGEETGPIFATFTTDAPSMGEWFVVGVADADNIIQEIAETNNIRAVSLALSQ